MVISDSHSATENKASAYDREWLEWLNTILEREAREDHLEYVILKVKFAWGMGAIHVKDLGDGCSWQKPELMWRV